MSNCVIWPYAKTDRGYGNFRFNGKTTSVHRLVYESYHGESPPVVMHTCDNPACFNIEHLKGGTHKDNTQDMIRKGRRVSSKGPDNPNWRGGISDRWKKQLEKK